MDGRGLARFDDAALAERFDLPEQLVGQQVDDDQRTEQRQRVARLRRPLQSVKLTARWFHDLGPKKKKSSIDQ